MRPFTQRATQLIAALTLVTAFSGAASAQVVPDSLWIAGTVVDSAGRGVAEALVLVHPDGSSTRTDSSGGFLMRVAGGPSALLVRRVGYQAFRAEVELVGGEDRRFRLQLTAIPQQLDAVVTRGRKPYMPPGAPAMLDDFYRRRAEGKGRTFTREEIERYGSVRAAVNTVPGVRPSADVNGRLTSITMTRCRQSEIAWFLDGRPVMNPPEFHDNDIEAIEVYRGPGSLPPEAVGNACAAIFVWTRR